MNYFEEAIHVSFNEELCKIAQEGASFGRIARNVGVGAVAAPTLGYGIAGAIRGFRRGGTAGAAIGFLKGAKRPFSGIYHGIRSAKAIDTLRSGVGSRTQAVGNLFSALKSGSVVRPGEFVKNIGIKNIFNPSAYKGELRRQVIHNVGKPVAAVAGGAVVGGAGTWALNR